MLAGWLTRSNVRIRPHACPHLGLHLATGMTWCTPILCRPPVSLDPQWQVKGRLDIVLKLKSCTISLSIMSILHDCACWFSAIIHTPHFQAKTPHDHFTISLTSSLPGELLLFPQLLIGHQECCSHCFTGEISIECNGAMAHSRLEDEYETGWHWGARAFPYTSPHQLRASEAGMKFQCCHFRCRRFPQIQSLLPTKYSHILME